MRITARAVPARAAGRLVIVAALLLGLFGMLGQAAAAADCHGPADTAPPAAAADVPSSHSMSGDTATVAAVLAHRPAASVHAPARGTPCTFTLPRRGLAGRALPALLGLAAAAAGDRTWPTEPLLGPGAAGRRAPPPSAGLLTRVCVSRT